MDKYLPHSLLILLLFSLAACVSTPVYNSNDPDKLLPSAKERIDAGLFSTAYSYLAIAHLHGTPEQQNAVLDLLKQYPQFIEHGRISLISRASGIALQNQSEADFLLALEADLGLYKAFAGKEHYRKAKTDILDIFRESRKSYPIMLPDSVHIGQARDVFLKEVPKKPSNIRFITGPQDPPIFYEVLTYNFMFEEGGPQIPTWFIFLNNKMINGGTGDLRQFEYSIHQSYLAELVEQKAISRADGERRINAKYKELYGEPHPLVNEYMLYKVVLAEKVDTGKLTRAEAEYQLAKKNDRTEPKGKHNSSSATGRSTGHSANGITAATDQCADPGQSTSLTGGTKPHAHGRRP